MVHHHSPKEEALWAQPAGAETLRGNCHMRMGQSETSPLEKLLSGCPACNWRDLPISVNYVYRGSALEM
jgi:hypothetical protein